MHLLGVDPVLDQRALRNQTNSAHVPGSIIAFDVNHHLMDVILHV